MMIKKRTTKKQEDKEMEESIYNQVEDEVIHPDEEAGEKEEC